MKQYKILNLILILTVMAVVSGCVKKQPVKNQQKAAKKVTTTAATSTVEVPPKEEIKYLPNGDVDISDWSTYRNDLYKIEIKYPPFLVISGGNDSDSFGIHGYINKKTYQLNDSNWQMSFTQSYNKKGLSVQDNVKQILSSISDNYKIKKLDEIYINNNYVIFQTWYAPPGFQIIANIVTEDYLLVGSLEIYSETDEFKEYDPKYINIFKSIVKNIKFDR